MSDQGPQQNLIAAFAVLDGVYFGMFSNEFSLKRSLKYLGRMEDNGQASDDLKDWFDGSRKLLEDNASVGEIPSVGGTDVSIPDGLHPSPWYAVFEVVPRGEAVGDLWVGRFFEDDGPGPQTLATGVYAIAETTNIQVLNDAPMMLGERAERWVIVRERDASGSASAEGDHGGVGGGLLEEW